MSGDRSCIRPVEFPLVRYPIWPFLVSLWTYHKTSGLFVGLSSCELERFLSPKRGCLYWHSTLLLILFYQQLAGRARFRFSYNLGILSIFVLLPVSHFPFQEMNWFQVKIGEDVPGGVTSHSPYFHFHSFPHCYSHLVFPQSGGRGTQDWNPITRLVTVCVRCNVSDSHFRYYQSIDKYNGFPGGWWHVRLLRLFVSVSLLLPPLGRSHPQTITRTWRIFLLHMKLIGGKEWVFTPPGEVMMRSWLSS